MGRIVAISTMGISGVDCCVYGSNATAQVVAYPRDIAEPFATEVAGQHHEMLAAQLAVNPAFRRRWLIAYYAWHGRALFIPLGRVLAAHQLPRWLISVE